MAPMKRGRESAAANRDKTRRRKHANDAEMLYKCLGQLCGEECDQELMPVADGGREARREMRRRGSDDHELEAASGFSDDEPDEPGRSGHHGPGPRSGRVSKPKHRKPGNSSHAAEFVTLKTGVQKAKRYICEALDFGVQSGYLMPKDTKGRLLRVSSDLLQSPEPATGRSSRAQQPERHRQERKRRRESSEDDFLEERDEEASGGGTGGGGAGVEERKNKGSRSKKRGGKKRGGKSRSRSRSKRRGGGRKRSGRSRSGNPDAEAGMKQTSKSEESQQDELDEQSSSKETGGNSGGRAGNEHEDDKSVKSAKSSKSSPTYDSQTTNEDNKKRDEEDASNYDCSDDDDDKKK